MEDITNCQVCAISFVEDPVLSRLYKVQIEPCNHVVCKDCMLEKLSVQAIPFLCPVGSCQKNAASFTTHREKEVSTLRSRSNHKEIQKKTYPFLAMDQLFDPQLDQHRMVVSKFIKDRKEFSNLVQVLYKALLVAMANIICTFIKSDAFPKTWDCCAFKASKSAVPTCPPTAI